MMDLRIVSGATELPLDGSHGYWLANYAGITMSPPEHQALRGAGMDGEVWLGITYAPRQVELRLLVEGSSAEERDQRLQDLASLLAPSMEVTLRAIRATTSYDLRCRLQDLAVRYQGPLLAEVQAQMRASVPFWQAPPVSQGWTTQGGSGGPAIPFAIPFAITSEGNAVNLTVFNPGQVPTWPVIIIDGPAAGPIVLTHQGQGASLTVAYSLGPGESLTVDMGARSARRGDGLDLYSYLTGRFWPLLPGANPVRFAGQGTMSGLVRYTPLYLGVG